MICGNVTEFSSGRSSLFCHLFKMGIALRKFIKKLFRGLTVSGIFRNKVLDLQILKLQLISGDSRQDQQFSAHIVSVEILPGIGLREPLLLGLFNQIAERNRAVEFIEKITECSREYSFNLVYLISSRSHFVQCADHRQAGPNIGFIAKCAIMSLGGFLELIKKLLI